MKTGKLLGVLYLVLCLVVGIIIGRLWTENSAFGVSGFAVNAPSDFLDNKEIIVYPDKIVILAENAQLSSYDSTNSMLPVLGNGANGIVVSPKSEEEINVGDIISFREGGMLIVHRVVSKGVDSDGVYFITQGDNSLTDDGKIRFGQVEKLLIGIVY